MNNFINNLKSDLPASLVVFFVALPLCLGIALASGAPLFSGIIAGIVGGIVVGAASSSRLGVSGPAAGLAVIVLAYIAALGGSFEAFLTAVFLMGIIQVILGFLRMGSIAYYFPSSVIKGMLSGIGILIIIKQIPHALGYFGNFPDDFGVEEISQSNGIFEFLKQQFDQEVIIISLISLIILILWENKFIKKNAFLKNIPGPLLAVFVGIFINNFVSLEEHQIVAIPSPSSFGDFLKQFAHPDFSQLKNPDIYVMALVMAIVGSLETLLCVEATDKLDPAKNITPTNRELKAQGLGNIVSGLFGGLPVTQVIVRSSANISFGAKSKISAISHGFLLLISAIFIPDLLNKIPLASLAAVLLVVGYKLAKPQIFIETYKLNLEQFLPFIITILGMIFFDLLKGVGLGMAVAVCFILYNNFLNSYSKIIDKEGRKNHHFIKLSQEVSFLNKGSILQMLDEIPNDSKVVIDASESSSIHYDVVEIIQNFKTNAKSKNISVETIGVTLKKI